MGGRVTGRHRRNGIRRRARGPFVVLTVLLAALGAGGYLGYRALTACEPVDLLVAADPAVVAPVRQALDDQPDVAGGCARYQVVDAAATLATDIRDRAEGLPAVWIPDSSLALGSLDTTSGVLVDQRPSLASSPVVLVVPQADAARYGDPAQPVTWDALLTHPQPPALPDPAVDRAGLAALSALHTAIGDEAGRPRPAFVAAVLTLSRAVLASPADGYAAVAREGAAGRALLASEQTAVRHNGEAAGGAGVPVTAVALRDATAALDFPFVRVHANQPRGLDRAADALEALLRGPVGRAAFGAAGLRAPDGVRLPGAPADATGSPPGWLGEQVPSAAPPPRPFALDTLRIWSSLTLHSRMLAVIDVSGSMAAQAGDSDRIGLAAGAAQAGLGLFPDTSSVGLWAFSSQPPPDPPWQELVPVGPLTEPALGASTRREALAAQVAGLREHLGGRTALYDTAVAATRAVRAGFEPAASNSVVLITDGRNEVPGGTDLPTAVQTLRAEADPTRPAPLIAIGLGPDVDTEALRQLAEATGGRSYHAQDPQDIRGVFLDALSQRACRPTCPG
ncbi:substrate-binding domain-containing protein [Pseudonocardia aurantiaca]